MGKARSERKLKRRSSRQKRQHSALRTYNAVSAPFARHRSRECAAEISQLEERVGLQTSSIGKLRAELDRSKQLLISTEGSLFAKAKRLHEYQAKCQNLRRRFKRLHGLYLGNLTQLNSSKENNSLLTITLETTRADLERALIDLKHAQCHALRRYEESIISRAEVQHSRQTTQYLQHNLSEARFALEEESRLRHCSQTMLSSAQNQCHHLSFQLLNVQTTCLELRSTLSTYEGHLKAAKKRYQALQMRCLRAIRSTSKATQRAAALATKKCLMQKIVSNGVYTAESRSLARLLIKAGCSKKHVGAIIQDVAKAIGITVRNRMSPRTVQRAELEGGVFAKVQLGHDIMTTDSLTISSDGTSNKNINFESQHITLPVPVAYSASQAMFSERMPKVRFAGVYSTPNHTAETQLATWIKTIDHISETYNRSPLAMNEGLKLNVATFARKLKGMHSDHAEDQKKLSRLIQDWKTRTTIGDLGSQALSSKSDDDLLQILEELHNNVINAVGGQETWDLLNDEDRLKLEGAAMENLKQTLGESALQELSPESQRDFNFYIWAGCCMHKELNSVKGGNAKMMAFWKDNNLLGPMTLANKDNAVTLTSSATSSAAARRALAVSAAGAIKLLSLAGALFNHKDDKKGQHDAFKFYFFSKTGRALTFPDTSNTRYHSFCDAAAELLTNLTLYIDFLEHIRDKKEKRAFNHLEQNVYDGLCDFPTLTELAVLVLYAESVTYGYARSVRGPGTDKLNILDLGPLHHRIKEHVRTLIANPQLILSERCNPTETTFDGQSWKHPAALSVIHQQTDKFPHLEGAFVAFLKGSLDTWERFTIEFEEGGSIDSLTPCERQRAWMSSTNDANEGALGAWRVHARQNPNGTVNQYNAKAMVRHNDTEAFIATMMSSEGSQSFGRKVAREEDANRLESKRRQSLAQAAAADVEEKRKRIAETEAKKTERMARISQIKLVLDEIAIRKMNVKELKEQLDAHKQTGANLPPYNTMKLKDEKVQCLLKAVKEHVQIHPTNLKPADDQLERSSLLQLEDSLDRLDSEDVELEVESDLE